MKTSYFDFLLCGAVIGAIVAGALGLVAVLIPLTKALALEYHVIVDFLLGLLFYGLLSALLVRLLLKLRPMPAGEYAMDSAVFTYWKLLTIVIRLGQGALLPFTPVFVRPLVAVLFGARVGANVALGGTIDDHVVFQCHRFGQRHQHGDQAQRAGNDGADGGAAKQKIKIAGFHCVPSISPLWRQRPRRQQRDKNAKALDYSVREEVSTAPKRPHRRT